MISLATSTMAAGDVLRFVLRVDTSNGLGPGTVDYTLNSDASLNPEGGNHIYAYGYGGDAIIPEGIYIGFEDIVPLNSRRNDRDYNDHQFVIAGLMRVPDGGITLAMLGVAVASLSLLRRRS